MKTINDISCKGKKVLVRVDFNVPVNEQFEITDTTRIEAAKPTIMKIVRDGGSAILLSHFGRPKGKDDKYSFSHLVKQIGQVLGLPTHFSPDCIGDVAENTAKNLPVGEVLLLENVRFYPEEEKGDEAFAAKLAKLGDIYVNDAFGTAHRAHASTTILAKFFPHDKYFGYLLAKEMDKIDHLIIGGGMAFTFVKAQGGQIGNSICEDDKLDLALDILKKAKEKGVQVHLPVDVIAANDFNNNASTQLVPIDQIPNGWQGLDAGEKSLEIFKKVILASKTILWNGPVGVFEMPNFAKGTIAVGEFVAEATAKGAFSLVGGGDSVAAVKQFGFENKVSYVSTGGGAMLESLEGKILPGIKAIND